MSVGKALSKAEERDLARKEKEREEAFEAWLSKKQEQEKKARLLQEEVALLEAKRAEEKQQMGRLAYEQWLANKRAEWQRAQKERHRQEVIEKYQSEQHAESRGQEVREAFTRWLAEKKQQQQLHREEEEAHQLRDDWRTPTPPLPGYCSVWSCDKDLAPVMLQRVRRPNSAFVVDGDASHVHHQTTN